LTPIYPATFVPHDDLLESVARRVADGSVLRLIKLWLKAPIEERDGDGKRRNVGGKKNKLRTPQGGVASPLLANIYMNRFLKHWRLSRCGEAFRAHVVSYADDFVILSRGRAAEALTWTKAVMTKLGLTLNEAKTSLKDARRERFDLLGYSFWPAPSIQPESAYVPVYECEPLEEERATAQGQSGRAAGISYRAHSRLYQG
jgi:RNA-directed DNA polymerase